MEENQEKKVPSNVYDYVLQLFVSPNTHKHLNEPFVRPDGLVYATNSFVCVRMDKAKTNKTYGDNEVQPEEVYEREETTDRHNINIKVNDLLAIIADYGLYVDLHRQCPVCHGSGEDECIHCGHESECQECYGGGKAGEEVPVKTIKFKQYTVVIEKYHFSPQYLHLIALAAKILGDDAIVIECRGNKCFVSLSDNTEFVLMLQHKS